MLKSMSTTWLNVNFIFPIWPVWRLFELVGFKVRILTVTVTLRKRASTWCQSISNTVPPLLFFVLFHQNRIMEELKNEMQHQGVKAWVENSKKTRYEIVSVEILGSIASAYLDVIPGLCGSSKVVFWIPFVKFFSVWLTTKNHLGKVFLCWQFTPDWPDEKDAFFLAEISVGPAVNATGGRVLERKIYVLIKGALKNQQFTSAFQNLSHFLSRGIPLDVSRVTGESSFPPPSCNGWDWF